MRGNLLNIIDVISSTGIENFANYCKLNSLLNIPYEGFSKKCAYFDCGAKFNGN